MTRRNWTGAVVLVLAILLGIAQAIAGAMAGAEYERKVLSQWNLADKASTIDAKAKHLDQFVVALERAGLDGTHGAVVYQTPDNSFDENLAALKSLQARVHSIESMDVRSLEYQQAIAQITGQEQGEAHAMLDVFRDAWMIEHHPMLWNWYGGLVCVAIALVAIFGFVLMVSA